MTVQLRTPEEAARWLKARVTGSLFADSRSAGDGDGFIAWPGAATDGRKYVSAAQAAGVYACLVEHEGAENFGFGAEGVATYRGLKAATGAIANAYFDAPSQHLQIVAITGTNGKTSTAWWLAQALDRLGRRCGIVGTLGIGEAGKMIPNGLTTPDPVLLQQQLRRFVNQGFAACALEASSIGIDEGRLDSTRIQVAVFTNFTQDHLDYHGSMRNYWQAKAKLFRWPGLRAAVINMDDPKGPELNAELVGAGVDVWTFSCVNSARLQAQAIRHSVEGLNFDVVEGSERHSISTRMVGQYNVSNLLAVMAALRALGLTLARVATACTNLLPVPGRMETLEMPGQPLAVVDYAHTPDALEKALMALRPVALNRGGQLWCVFGCGGDRDASKRPLMVAVAEKHADRVVLTSDNPRSEPPMAIVGQMLQALERPQAAIVQADRAAAIRQALKLAQPQDVVLLAGKGHENYQEINGLKNVFSDRDHVHAAFSAAAQTRQREPSA